MIAAPVEFKKVVNKRNAFNSDIIEVLESNYSAAVENVKEFSARFKAATPEKTALNVWEFLRNEIRYKRDPAHLQLIRIPGRFFHDGEGDCKSYALAACSILSNLGFKTSFRYTSYNSSTVPTHVYCVAEKNGKRFIIDGVYHTFNKEKKYTFKTDHKMNIETLSGTETRRQFDLNNRKHLEYVLNRFGDKKKLAALIIQKKLSGSRAQLPYTKEQLSRYKTRLENNIRTATSNFVRAILQEELNKVNAGTVTGGIFGTGEDHSIGKIKIFKKIGKGLKKIGKGLKKIGLAPNRNAFLLLVKLNVKGLASKLKKANQTKLKSTWEKIGGDYNKLVSAFNSGSKKKAIGGTDAVEIGILPAGVATALSLAVPIIAIVAKLFGQPKPGESLMPGETSGTEGLLNTFDTLKTAAIDAGVLPESLRSADNLANEIEDGKADVSDKESGFGGMVMPLAIAAVALVVLKK